MKIKEALTKWRTVSSRFQSQFCPSIDPTILNRFSTVCGHKWTAGIPFFFSKTALGIHIAGKQKGDPDEIAKCVAIFRNIIPWGIVAISARNLGIAANYERAEQEIFGRIKAPHALFLEDDMLLSPNFLTVTRMLLQLAEREQRIAYVSAYGNFWAGVSEQVAHRRELIHMHENWGFAMTRRAWLAERPFRQAYLRLLERTDYTQRDAKAILQFYERRGWKTSVTSQDAARWIASLELGKVRLTTFVCNARYIGRVGVHWTGKFYDQSGLAGATFFTGPPCPPDLPTNEQITDWLETERRRFTTEAQPFYMGHGTGLRSQPGT